MDDYKTRIEKKVEETTRYIKELPKEIMDLLIEMPEEGIKYHHAISGNESVAKPLVAEGDYVDIDSYIGHFDQNNGMISVVMPNRKTYITPARLDVSEALEEAGYKRGLAVPLSSGNEVIDDELIAARLLILKDARDKYVKQRAIDEFNDEVVAISTKKGIEDLPEEFFRVCQKLDSEGLAMKRLGKETESKMKGFFDPLAMRGVSDNKKLEAYIGSYNYNGGTTVFVDQNGDTWITPFSQDAKIFLDEAGYTQNVDMPALMDSMDEFADPKVSERYETLRDAARIRRDEISTSIGGERHYEDFYKVVEYIENPDLTYERTAGYRK